MMKKNKNTFILLISGWAGIKNDWGAIPKLLSSQTSMNVITYDPRCFGQSQQLYSINDQRQEKNIKADGDDEEELTWEQMCCDAIDVMKAASLDTNSATFHLIGVSMGGMVVQTILGSLLGLLEWQTTNPLNIESATLISSTHKFQETKSNMEFLHSLDMFTGGINNNDGDEQSLLLLQKQAANKFFSVLGQDFLSKPGRTKIKEKLVSSFCKSPRFHNDDLSSKKSGIIIRQRNLLITFDSTPWISTIGQHFPILVIHGDKDSVFAVDNAFQLQDALGSKCQVQIVQNSNHFLWITNGPTVVEQIARFLDDRQGNK